MSKVRIDIHGSCVTRDVFSYDDNGEFQVGVYVARNSIFSLFTPSIDYKKYFRLSDGFQDRMVKYNCCKNFFCLFEKQPADYFIVDLIDERFSLQEIEGSYITWTPQCRKGVIGFEEKLFHARSLPRNILKETISYYCDRISQIYPSNRIIVHRAYFSPLYKDKEGTIRMFPEGEWKKYQELNEFIDRLYDYIINRLKCHQISQRPILIADENNKWTLAPMHYVPEEYIHILREVKKYIYIQQLEETKKATERNMELAMLKYLSRARIDIKNQGVGNNVKILVKGGERCKITTPKWFSKDGTGYVLETEDKNLMLELECEGVGILVIYLRGVDVRTQEGGRLPIWVDYTSFAVNEEQIFSGVKPCWHDKPYKHIHHVKDKERIKVEISWSIHGYKGEELTRLLSFMRG